MDYFYSAVTRTEHVKTMGYFILHSLELRISKQWFLLFNSPRSKDIKTLVSFILQSL